MEQKKNQLCNFQCFPGRAELERNHGNVWNSSTGGCEEEIEMLLIIPQGHIGGKEMQR